MIINYMYPFTETFIDYPDDESIAISIYFLGCDNGCKDCSNPEFQNENYKKGQHTDLNTFIQRIHTSAYSSKTNKLVFLGGDATAKQNIEKTKEILKNLYKNFDICIYTGHTVDYVKENGISGFTFLKCGKYLPEKQQQSEKTDDYLQFASSNQELYDSQFNLLSENGRYYFKRG